LAIYFTESVNFDTGTMPQVTYTSANDAVPKLGGLSNKADGTEYAATWMETQAAEVDKAAPVFINAITADSGYGVGVASNGMLDAIKFTFSEAVQG